VPPAPMEAPNSYRITLSAPSADALTFSKEDSPAADALIGRCILFKWPVVGWCMGKIFERNKDARKTRNLADGTRAKKNFTIYYDIDDETIETVLRLDEYGGDEDMSWVLLESLGA
jgi:hypothetical protein